MTNLMWIHEFWLQQCPFFIDDLYFMIYVLDVVSIFIFFKVFLTIMPYMLGIRTDVSKW